MVVREVILVRRAITWEHGIRCDGCPRKIPPGESYRNFEAGPGAYGTLCERTCWPKFVEAIALAARRSPTVRRGRHEILVARRA